MEPGLHLLRIFGWAYGSRWEPLLSDLLRVSKALEGLGFRYINGEVVLLDGEELA